MGSYASPSNSAGPPDRESTEEAKLGDLLSGRFADVEVDSVEAVRQERKRR